LIFAGISRASRDWLYVASFHLIGGHWPDGSLVDQLLDANTLSSAVDIAERDAPIAGTTLFNAHE
jgi:hypothetical protein